ncbi:hypothetical protein [Micromonospora sp. WMMD812]|uniref:hypothetical protein n=1 Tax=Micromonospora sp. WMMD812 TaxID=3015152 RepID=UPI00248D3573|nr:hypothetical protein [Micromonospora sp. WMMD812]WBB65478.1 hypothetical protein O7603_19985 [Micromonospora sp. WMMD812]
MPRNLPASAAAASAALTVAATLVLPVPADAAPLGGVRLSATSGTVDATPIFASATATAPCPTGFGRNAQLRVGPPGGPYSNLARPLSAGGYDRAAVTAQPNRSFATALGGAPVDGEWWVVVECVSETQGVHPERFVTPITVSGRQWRAGRPAGAAPARPDADGSLVVSPSAGASAASGTPSTAAPTPNPGGSVDAVAEADVERRLTGNEGSGSASLANLWWILALLGALLVVGTTWLTTRRPAPRGRDAARGR